MSEVVTYAKAGGPPDNWCGLLVLDRDSGEYVGEVCECDTEGGWLVRYKTDAQGNFYLDGDEVARERLTGRFALIPGPAGRR